MNQQIPVGYRLIIDWQAQLPPSPYLHKYGGLPSNGATLPTCPGCGVRHHLLFQIDLSDPSLVCLKVNGLDYLFVFSCLNCASYESPMYYTLKDRGKQIVIQQESSSVYVHQYPDPLNEHHVTLRSLRHDEYPFTQDALACLLAQEGKHQIGGMPTWVQHEEHIPCLNCNKEMSYLAMVDSELYIGKDGFRDKGHMFGDEGILYIFVCRDCGGFAAKGQCL